MQSMVYKGLLEEGIQAVHYRNQVLWVERLLPFGFGDSFRDVIARVEQRGDWCSRRETGGLGDSATQLRCSDR